MGAPARDLVVHMTAVELRDLVREAVRAEVEQLRGELSSGLTTDQAAEVAGVEAKTIREWVAIGRLAATRRGRHIRIARADLERATRGDTPDPHEAAAVALRALRGGG